MADNHQTAKTQYVTNGDIKYAYRRFGKADGVPVIFLIHFRGTMDYWDPLLINTIAATRPVILFDNAGVGHSTGKVATSIKGMAQHVIDFLALINVKEVDLLGFSMGGYVAQLVALNAPSGQIRKLILAGTGPSAGEDGRINHPAEQQEKIVQLAGQPKPEYEGCFDTLFFYPSETSQEAGRAWFKRANERNKATSGEERSNFVSYGFADGGAGLQDMVTAYGGWEDPANRAEGSFDRLGDIKIPVFIGQGVDDFMIPTKNSYVMQQKIPNARLKLFPDSGHGFLYQYAEEFGNDVAQFLDLA